MDENLRQKIARHKMAAHVARIDPRKRKRTKRANIPEKEKTPQGPFNKPERQVMKVYKVTFEELAKYWNAGKGKKGGRSNMHQALCQKELTPAQREKFTSAMVIITAIREHDKEQEAKRAQKRNTNKNTKTA